jgi:Collagen triple helix repeat (20 copies)
MSISRIHQKLGTAGFVISIIALVAALAGGAFAASGGGSATASKVKQGKQGKPGKPGKNGAPGAAGANGKDGAKGDTGAVGPAGKDGAKGDTGAVGPAGQDGIDGTDGIDGADGADGAPGAPGTFGGAPLEPGVTETGSFAASTSTDTGGVGIAAISFQSPLTNELPPTSVKGVKIGETPPAECDDGVAPAPSPANPEADPEFLCVFLASSFLEATLSIAVIVNSAGTAQGASVQGSAVEVTSSEGTDLVWGTWAVTG